MIAVKTQKKAPAAKKIKSITKIGLVCAEGERCFWSNDGKVLATLKDLEGALSAMHEDTFAHHVTNDKNDFADWVEFVLLDLDCASLLRKAKTKKAALSVVKKALVHYHI